MNAARTASCPVKPTLCAASHSGSALSTTSASVWRETVLCVLSIRRASTSAVRSASAHRKSWRAARISSRSAADFASSTAKHTRSANLIGASSNAPIDAPIDVPSVAALRLSPPVTQPPRGLRLRAQPRLQGLPARRLPRRALRSQIRRK